MRSGTALRRKSPVAVSSPSTPHLMWSCESKTANRKEQPMPRSTAEASLSIGALRERWMPLASAQATVSARTPLAFNSAARAARSVVLTGAPSDGCSTVRSREGTPSCDADDHLAETLALGQAARGGREVLERVHGVDRGTPRRALQVLAERGELARAAHRGAEERAPLPVDLRDRDRRLVAA